jgi:iron complex outermembrane receptor protein
MARFLHRALRSLPVRTFILCSVFAAPASAFAQTSPIETIIVTGERQQDTAAAVAPTTTPLDAVQPTSVISQDFLSKNFPLSGNYDEAIKFTPSVFDTAPNGPGLAESQNISIRGFQDGQFNVTFDGIPFQDANDFTHHSTSYFMAHDLGLISVDRGPGTAATIGNATFGGTVSLLSKAPADAFGVSPYISYGSFNTLLGGVQLDSGTIDDTGGTRVMLDAEGLNSDGYLTNMGVNRQDVFLKVVQPLDSDTTLAFVTSVNHVHQNISLGATAPEIAAFGPNYALGNDPTQQNYFGYNFDKITTDFEFFDLQHDFGDGWTVDSKVYTYAYFHTGFNGEDPNGEFPNGTCLGTGPTADPADCVSGTFHPNDVPGQVLTNDYRSIGTITRFNKDFSFGDVKFGVWYDRQRNFRRLVEVDMSQPGQPANFAVNTGQPIDPVTGNPTDRDLHQTLTTIQPYLQLDLTPIENLTLSPGVRYSYFDRSVNAAVNVKSGVPQVYDNKWDALLPSFVAHYAIQPNWSAYAQAAEGFLAPNENFFTTGGTPNFSPQRTWNYQVGSSIQLDDLAASADAYYIDFSNFIHCVAVGANENCTNLGGVTYEGLEGDVTYKVGYGFSLYADGSLNSAKQQKTGAWISNAPQSTYSIGGIYSDNGLYGSIIGHFIGPRIGDGLPAIFTVDASLDYDLGELTGLRDTWIKLEMNNLTDQTKIINIAGQTVGAGNNLYWTQPGRSVFVTLTTTLP